MLSGGAHASRVARPLGLMLLVAGVGVTIALRRNAGLVAEALGPVPTVYIVSGIGAALYAVRVGDRPGRAVDGAKIVAGVHLVAMALLSPLWARTSDPFASRLIALSAPFGIYLAWQSWLFALGGGKDRLETFVAILFPRRMAPLLAAELRVIGLALFAWGSPRQGAGQAAFTSAGVLAPVLLAVAALAGVEVVTMHLVIRHWSHSGAYTIAMLGALTAVYMVGLAKSLKYMPTLVTPDALLVRLGHFHSVEIPYETIRQVSSAAPGAPAPAGSLDLAPLSAPNVLISLAAEREITGLTGRKRRFRAVALRLDDPKGFEASLQPHLPG